MAAPTECSSLTWITDLNLFKESLEAGFVNKESVSHFVSADCVENVFKGMKQFNFWSRRLQGSLEASVNTVTFMGPNGLLRPDVDFIQDVVSSSFGPGCIVSINYAENSNFVSFVLKSPEAAQGMRQVVAEVNGALACFVPVRSHKTFRVRILWTPLFYELPGVVKTLLPWCETADLVFDSQSFKNGEVIMTNRISGLITLRDGVSLSDLPHVVKLCGSANSYVLILIGDRPSICFKCRTVGHLKKDCDLIRCVGCHTTHKKSSGCRSKSYASVLGSLSTSSVPHSSLGHLLDDDGGGDVPNGHQLLSLSDVPEVLGVTCSSQLLARSASSDLVADDSLDASGILGGVTPLGHVPLKLSSVSEVQGSPLSEALSSLGGQEKDEEFCVVQRRVTKSMSQKKRCDENPHASLEPVKDLGGAGLFDVLMDEVASDRVDNITAIGQVVVMESSKILTSDLSVDRLLPVPMLFGCDGEEDDGSRVKRKRTSLSGNAVVTSTESKEMSSSNELVTDSGSEVEKKMELVENKDCSIAKVVPRQARAVECIIQDLISRRQAHTGPEVEQSTFKITCLKCGWALSDLWPIRRMSTCIHCGTAFIEWTDRRYYPIAGSVSVVATLSNKDLSVTSSLTYLHRIISSGVTIDFQFP